MEEEILGSKLNDKSIDPKSSINYLLDTLMYLRDNGTTFAQRQIINRALGELNKLNIGGSERLLPKYIYYDPKRDRYSVHRWLKTDGKWKKHTGGYSKSLPQAMELLKQFNLKYNLNE